MNLNLVSKGQYQPILPGIIQSRLQISKELSKNEWSEVSGGNFRAENCCEAGALPFSIL